MAFRYLALSGKISPILPNVLKQASRSLPAISDALYADKITIENRTNLANVKIGEKKEILKMIVEWNVLGDQIKKIHIVVLPLEEIGSAPTNSIYEIDPATKQKVFSRYELTSGGLFQSRDRNDVIVADGTTSIQQDGTLNVWILLSESYLEQNNVNATANSTGKATSLILSSRLAEMLYYSAFPTTSWNDVVKRTADRIKGWSGKAPEAMPIHAEIK